ncbi:MAG TPA: hypothetical protein VK057_06090 [Bacillota bacterium]|nr:hypothetical protein [Bacillota bacterium]
MVRSADKKGKADKILQALDKMGEKLKYFPERRNRKEKRRNRAFR